MPPLQDDEYEIPLRDQRYFGSGLKRKRIQFVPSSSSSTESARSLHRTPSTSVAERYRDVVLRREEEADVGAGSTASPSSPDGSATPAAQTDILPTSPEHGGQANDIITCSTHHNPLPKSNSPPPTTSPPPAQRHETSIPNQLLLPHTHPPSSLNRRSKALALLTSYGWDPDSRKGLGANEEGILYPIKARENAGRAGLGARLAPERVVERRELLDAGRVRVKEMEGRERMGRLREMFYRSEVVVRYLGE